MNYNQSSHHSNLNIEAIELLRRKQQGDILQILDVREPVEFYTFNIGGLNLPLGELKERMSQLTFSPTDEIIIICQAGLRSKTAQSILQQNGYENTRNLNGGLLALRKLNY
jgi:rhodanese-related sulfurtransferase